MSSNKGMAVKFSSLWRRLLVAVLIFGFTFTLSGLLSVSSAYAATNEKYASIVMDADTGMILHQRYADKKLHPASLTKIMTLLLLFDALEQGEVRLNDRIRISHHAASMQPSKLGLRPGSSIRVEDAIRSLVTKSANDIAVAVAEHLEGSESKFAAAMTRRAHSIGMSRTTFRNASGLHHPRQISTARDIAKMARYVITYYPEYYRYFSLAEFTYDGRTYTNHNKLLGKYSGMDGMKTGYIQASGFNLVASAVRNNNRIIGVVFGGRSGYTRNVHMETLLDRGFEKVNEIRIASANAPIPPHKPQVILAMNGQSLSTGMSSDTDTQSATEQDVVLASFSPSFKGSVFSQMIGEGDYDPEASQRLEAGLLAISAIKGEAVEPIMSNYRVEPAVIRTTVPQTPTWAIQVGAFNSKSQGDQALAHTKRKLPALYASAKPVIVPLRTRTGWLFRARLEGYNRAQAFEACRYLQECMPIAP